MIEEIPQEELDRILRATQPIPPPKQRGPWRHFEREMQCLNNHGGGTRNCRSPTYYKVQGIPLCSKHAIIKLNEMLIELGVEK